MARKKRNKDPKMARRFQNGTHIVFRAGDMTFLYGHILASSLEPTRTLGIVRTYRVSYNRGRSVAKVPYNEVFVNMDEVIAHRLMGDLPPFILQVTWF